MSGLAQQAIMNESDLQWNVGDCVTDVCWAPDSSKVAVSDAAGMITVFDMQTDAMLWSVIAHVSGTQEIEWRSDGEVIASAGQDGMVKLWDVNTGETLGTFNIGEQWVEHITWSPNGKVLAACAGKTIVAWDIEGNEVLRNDDHVSTVTAIAWKMNSQELATSCYKGVHLFRMGNNKPYRTLHCLGSLITLAWSPDGDSICAGSQDRVLQFWRLSAKKGGHAEMKGYPEKVSNIDWNATGTYLASAGGNTAVIWKNKGKGPAGTAPKLLKGHQGRITQLAYQHKGPFLASGAQDGDIMVWYLKEGMEPLKKWHMNSEITRLAWSPDDQTLIAGNKTGQLQHFSVAKAA